MIRTSETLRRDQAEILSSYRQDMMRQGSVAVLPRPGGTTAPGIYGRVSSVVGSDPTYGPHLVVVRQEWSGTPPTVWRVASVPQTVDACLSTCPACT